MKTIHQQLRHNLLLTIGLLLVAGGMAIYVSTRASLLTQFDAALSAKARALTTLTEEKDGKVEIEFSDELMPDFKEHGRDFFEAWRADGQLVERSSSLRDAHLPLRQDLSDAPLFWNSTLPDGRPARVTGMKFNPHDSDDEEHKEQMAGVVLIVATLRGDLDRTLSTLQFVLIAGGALLLLATALAVPRVLKRELRPLEQLADDAALIDASTLSTRFPTANLPAELTPIATRLNELLSRLENSFERERRFSSDVAHEFRTPVAELRGIAELAIKLPDTRTANTDNEVLSIALHLETILTKLLTLARGESAGLAVARGERVSLALLTESVCGQFREKATVRRLALNCEVPEEAFIETDPALLRSLLNNLVDNAVEYSPSGTTVDVQVEIQDQYFSVTVSNTVEDLVEEDLPRLFNRFWRKNAARVSNGHTGLGLPLARAFAHALGYELTVDLIRNRRIRFTLKGHQSGE